MTITVREKRHMVTTTVRVYVDNQCGIEIDAPEDGSLPPGWYELKVAHTDTRQPRANPGMLHFHIYQCLEDYTAANRPETP